MKKNIKKAIIIGFTAGLVLASLTSILMISHRFGFYVGGECVFPIIGAALGAWVEAGSNE